MGCLLVTSTMTINLIISKQIPTHINTITIHQMVPKRMPCLFYDLVDTTAYYNLSYSFGGAPPSGAINGVPLFGY